MLQIAANHTQLLTWWSELKYNANPDILATKMVFGRSLPGSQFKS